jgi:hypothetical protein
LECPGISKDVEMFVVGRHGIAFHRNFKKVTGNKIETSFTATKEMLPESKVVFYAFKGNNIFYGTTDMRLDAISENFVSEN